MSSAATFTRLPAPPALAHLPAVTHLLCVGDTRHLARIQWALVGSARCPAALLLAQHDLTRHWRAQETCIISGFHAPVEAEVLAVLLQGTGPVVICLGRGGHNLRISPAWQPALAAGRLLIISPFAHSPARTGARTAPLRNQVAAALAPAVFIPYAAPASKTLALAHALTTQGKPCATFDSPHTQPLQQLGAQTLDSRNPPT